MGNSESSGAIDASYGNAELAKLTTPVAAIDTRFCNSAPVRIQLKKIFYPANSNSRT